MMKTEKSFSSWQLLCFGVLTTPIAMGGLALVMFVPTFYAIDMGLGLASVGAVFVFGRVLDVITDPLIGYFSDQTRSRFGPRIPWIVIGTPIYCLSVWLLFSPPENAQLWYLILGSGLYFMFYTIVDVPYSSIGLEISSHIHERTFLASSKAVFQVVGAVAAASIPFVVGLTIPHALPLIAKIIIALSILGIVLLLIFVPRTTRAVTEPRLGLWQSCKWVLKQSSYRSLISVFFIIQSANALTGALAVLYISNIIKAPQMVGAALGLLFLATAFFLPLWIFISYKFSKTTSWLSSIVLCCLALLIAPFLQEGDVLGLLIMCCLLGACFGCDAIMPTSILADIVYQGEQDGKNRFSATYLAFKNSVSKLTFVIPMGLAFPILGWMGFEENSTNGDVQLNTLIFFFAILPILIRLVGFGVLTKVSLKLNKAILQND